MSKSLGAVLLAFNEEEFIEEAIRSILDGVDSLTVIDQNSTDKTQEIVRSIPGVNYMLHADNFATKGETYFRDMAVDVCGEDWLMIIDGDEVMQDDWHFQVRPLLNECGDRYGSGQTLWWHFFGSHEYVSAVSPERRTVFVRNHPGLKWGPCQHWSDSHLSYHPSLEPKEKIMLPINMFHLGYMRKNMMFRWERNVRRGDQGKDVAAQDALLAQYAANPIGGLSEVIPSPLPVEAWPIRLRPQIGNIYEVDYDVANRKIRSRKRIIFPNE